MIIKKKWWNETEGMRCSDEAAASGREERKIQFSRPLTLHVKRIVRVTYRFRAFVSLLVRFLFSNVEARWSADAARRSGHFPPIFFFFFGFVGFLFCLVVVLIWFVCDRVLGCWQVLAQATTWHTRQSRWVLELQNNTKKNKTSTTNHFSIRLVSSRIFVFFFFLVSQWRSKWRRLIRMWKDMCLIFEQERRVCCLRMTRNHVEPLTLRGQLCCVLTELSHA